MKVIRIEYMLGENTWKCIVIAKDVNDAISTLAKSLKAEFRVMSTEDVCDVHLFSQECLSSLSIEKKVVPVNKPAPVEGKRRPGRPPMKK